MGLRGRSGRAMLELMPHDVSVLPGFYVDNRSERGVTVEHDVRSSGNLEG